MRWATVLALVGLCLVACGDDDGGSSTNETDAAASGGASGWPGEICTPGEKVDVGACGNCGTERRTCDASGHFGPTVCEDVGECAAGEMKTESCGPCSLGTRTATCSNECTWGAWGSCDGAGCTPETTDNCCIGRGCGCRVCQEDCSMSNCKVPCPV